MQITTNQILYASYQKHLLATQKSMERLSTGDRINRASDDASGLSQSEKMRSQIRGMTQASRSIQDGKSLLEMADKTMELSHDILKRLNELAVKGSSDTLTGDDRVEMGKEVHALIEEFHHINSNANYNGKSLFDGNGAYRITTSETGRSTFVAFGYFMPDGFGGNNTDGDYVVLDDFKIGQSQAIGTKESMQNLLSVTRDAMHAVSSERGSIGAKYSRLTFAEKNLQNQSDILTKADSRIRDVDIARESMELAKHQMLAEASMAMLSQSMQNQQKVLMLLR